jgi:hypothetical protein
MATISEEMYVVLIARKMSYTDTGSPTYSDYLGMFGTIVNGKPYQDYFGHKRPFFSSKSTHKPKHHTVLRHRKGQNYRRCHQEFSWNKNSFKDILRNPVQ